MFTLKMAIRNLVRNRRRSLITASAITFSYALLIMFMGIGDGAHAQMIDMGVRMGSGHVVVQAKGYQTEQTLDLRIESPGPILEAMEAAGVEGAFAPRLIANGLVRAGSKAVGVVIAGVDPEREAVVNDLASDEKLVDGGWLRPRSALPYDNMPSDLYLGKTLAETLDVKVGDRVGVTVQPRDDDDPRTAAFLVRGVFATGSDEMDGFFVMVPLEDAQPLLGVGDALTQIGVILDDQSHTQAVHAQIAPALADYPVEVLPWQQALPELYEFIVLDDASLYLFIGIVFLLVALGIFNTVLTSVIERTREFGLMRSLGARGTRVLRLVLGEAAVLGVFATILGLVLGLAGNWYFTVEGLDYGALLGGESYTAAGVNFATVMYAKLGVMPTVRSFVGVLLIIVLSAIWPAVRAARLKPLEALHHV